jgi:DNA-binding MarR family transcriptional regulator
VNINRQDMTPEMQQDSPVLGILDEFVGMYLRAAYESAYRDFTDRLGEDALRPGYFTILTLIVKNPGISQTQICQAARRDKSSVAKALRWMEDMDLITRTRPDHDRRTALSEATEKGHALQDRMEARGREHLAALNDAIGAERRQEFIATLKEIITHLPDAAARA